MGKRASHIKQLRSGSHLNTRTASPGRFEEEYRTRAAQVSGQGIACMVACCIDSALCSGSED